MDFKALFLRFSPLPLKDVYPQNMSLPLQGILIISATAEEGAGSLPVELLFGVSHDVDFQSFQSPDSFDFQFFKSPDSCQSGQTLLR